MSATPDQRHYALERANQVRLARAELKHRIASAEITAAEVILDPPTEASTWRIGDLLRAQRRWGTERVRRLLGRLWINETRLVGALTLRQRRLLASELGREEAGERDQHALRQAALVLLGDTEERR